MKKKRPQSFEEALSRLETLTQAMQSSEMPLEDALAAYQEGNELVRYCQTKLAEVEQKLQILDAGELKELNLNPENELKTWQQKPKRKPNCCWRIFAV